MAKKIVKKQVGGIQSTTEPFNNYMRGAVPTSKKGGATKTKAKKKK